MLLLLWHFFFGLLLLCRFLYSLFGFRLRILLLRHLGLFLLHFGYIFFNRCTCIFIGIGGAKIFIYFGYSLLLLRSSSKTCCHILIVLRLMLRWLLTISLSCDFFLILFAEYAAKGPSSHC